MRKLRGNLINSLDASAGSVVGALHFLVTFSLTQSLFNEGKKKKKGRKGKKKVSTNFPSS